MKQKMIKPLSVSALLLGVSCASLQAGSFAEISEHIDLDGDFVGYMDFDGEGVALGEKLNVVYQEFASANPDVPPFPISFPDLFQALGFGSIRAMGMSSTEVEAGLHRNRSVTLLDGEPTGVFGIYDLTRSEFRAAALAPADASTVFSGRLNFEALATAAVDLGGTAMGPMGEGLVMQGLSQPVPGTDLAASEIIEALSGGMDLIFSQDLSNPQAPEVKAYLSFKGAATLLPRLEPLLNQMGVEFEETESGRLADLSMFLEGAPMGLFVEAPSSSSDLLIYTDADWVGSFGQGETLVDTEAFQRVAGRLPKSAAYYAYSSGLDVGQLLKLLEGNPELAPFAPAIGNAVETLLGGFLAPSASATFRERDAMVTETYASFSYKDAVAALPVGIAGGVAVGVAMEKMTGGSIEAPMEEEMMEDYEEEPVDDM